MGTVSVKGVGDFTVDDAAWNKLSPEQQQQWVHEAVAQVTGRQAPEGNLADAAWTSLKHQLPASAEGGVAGFARVLGANQTADEWDAAAQAHRAAAAQEYRRPDSVSESPWQALLTGRPLGAAKAAAYSAAEGVGPAAGGMAAALGIAAGGAPALVTGGIGTGLAALQSMDAVRQSKAAAGLDPNQITGTDLGNTALQTVLSAAPFGAGQGAGFVGKQIAQAGESALRAAGGSVVNDISNYSQGAKDPFEGTLRRAMDAAATGAVMKPALDVGLQAAQAGIALPALGAQRAIDKARVGADARALAAETADWNQAVSSRAEQIAAQNPGMDPEFLQARAEAAAIGDGAVKPDLSPGAQRQAARLALIQMYQAEKARNEQSRADGSKWEGKDDANVFKNINDQIGSAIDRAGKVLRDNVLIDNEALQDLKDANAAAGKHNRNFSTGEADDGGLPTAVDRIRNGEGDWGNVDPAIRDTLVGQLLIRNEAARNGLINRTRGPIELLARVSGSRMAAIGAVAGAPFAGLGAMEGIAGAMGSQIVHALGTKWAKDLDSTMGWNKPQALSNMDAFLRFADANNIQPLTSAGALHGIIDQLRSGHFADPVAEAAARQAMAQQAAQAAPKPPEPGPVTASGRWGDATPPSVPPEQQVPPPQPITVPGRPQGAPQAPPAAPPVQTTRPGPGTASTGSPGVSSTLTRGCLSGDNQDGSQRQSGWMTPGLAAGRA